MKRFLILTLCAAMWLSCFMAGCTDKPDEPATSDTTDGETTQSVTEAEESETAYGTADDTTEEATTEEVAGPAEPAVTIWPVKAMTFNNKNIQSVSIHASEDICEQYAARELQKYLEKMSIAVKEDGDFPITLQIDPALGDDSYRIETGSSVEDGMAITGGNGRGVIYGVYGFLEKKAGVRFYTPDLETCSAASIRLNGESVMTYEPTFEFRHTNWYTANDAVWSQKNGMNCDILLSDENKYTAEMGGTQTIVGWVHTFSWITGHGSEGQPCLNDPQVLANAIGTVRYMLEQDPTLTVISVSQNDNEDYCKCEKCAAIDEIEGSPSGNIIRFVNAIAADIAEDFPNAVLETLAYRYSIKAPAVTKPLPNVCVRLAPVFSCNVHAYNDPDCPINVEFAQSVAEWSMMCERLYVWDYSTNFSYFIPTFENLYTIRENMRFFAEHNVKGMFSQGNDQSPSAEFGELRAYLLLKLMQNPLMSKDEYYDHMDEFLKAYYGEGWRYIRAYIDLTSGQPGINCRGCYDAPLKAADRARYVAMEETVDQWWDKAEAMAGDRVEYVKRSRLQWRYIKLMYAPDEEEAKAFIADIATADIHWREWRFTSAIGEGSNLSKAPDKWIYD